MVEKAPQKIVLTFDRPAEQMGTTLAVSGPNGAIEVSDATLVNDKVEVTIGGKLPAGKYTVEWRVTSADGHAVSGTFAFSTKQPTSYQDPSGGQAAPDAGQDPQQDSASNSRTADRARGVPAQDPSQSATSTSSGTFGAILIVIGVALVVIILIVIGVLTLRRHRSIE